MAEVVTYWVTIFVLVTRIIFMRFDIITIFPHIFDLYFNTSIIKRAQAKRLTIIKAHDLRRWAVDGHKTARPLRSAKQSGRVDDRPYGGGPGMILKVEPIYKALSILKSRTKNQKLRTILLTPKGKQFDQKIAKRYAKLDRIVLICGRYEGIDERVTRFVDEQISIGPYVLTGGELPAMIVVDTVTRLIPGVIKPESLQEETFSLSNVKCQMSDVNLEYPQYTRPEVFTYKDASVKIRSLKVPKVLLSGNHEEIKQWRKRRAR